MEIQGPGFNIYDAKYLQVSQRDHARSVKPNVFRETEDPAANVQNLTKDMVALSPEAQEFMRILKKYGKDSPELAKFLENKRMKELIYSFRELRDLVYGEEEEEDEDDPARKKKKKKQQGTPASPNQFIIPLGSGKIRGGAGGGTWTRTRELIDRMVVFTPSEEIKRTLIKELEVMGESIIETVKTFGVKIIILPRNMTLPQIKIKGMTVVSQGERTFDGRPWEVVRGLYDNSRRLMVIGEENIGQRRSTAIHEFGHAYDHTFSERHQRRLPLSVQLWNMFRKDREGLVSDYAGTNPQEYFAESVEAYFREDGREKLQREDKEMYNYLENLFGAV
ncbi:MAG: hypothetical protein LWY06_16835 [Firmicutes bacterium]|nr:hypothetical protein [Bacillota bacterium]